MHRISLHCSDPTNSLITASSHLCLYYPSNYMPNLPLQTWFNMQPVGISTPGANQASNGGNTTKDAVPVEILHSSASHYVYVSWSFSKLLSPALCSDLGTESGRWGSPVLCSNPSWTPGHCHMPSACAVVPDQRQHWPECESLEGGRWPSSHGLPMVSATGKRGWSSVTCASKG